jgi:hypothetical protein
MKQLIKSLLPTRLLLWATRVRMKLRPNVHELRSRRQWEMLGKPDVVLGGPFKGMRYIAAARGSSLVTKLLGTYEMELHPFVTSLPRSAPDTVIDVGAAEGYYAVGLARMLPAARVITFDFDPVAVDLMRQLAQQNGVTERIDVRGNCTHSTLEAACGSSTLPLVVCDCEGYEDVLLDPAAVPSLRRAMILVELHEHVVPGVGGRIRQRFESTHEVEIIPTRPRDVNDLSPEARAALPAGAAERVTADVLDEHRPGLMSWFVMRPRVSANV